MASSKAPRRGSNGRFLKTAKDAEQAEQAVEALRMRGQGLSIRQIADRLKLSKSAVHRMIETAYSDVVQEPAAVALMMELERLDGDLVALNTAQHRIQNAMRPPEGEPDAPPAVPLTAGVTALVRIVEAKQRIGARRDRLLGLGAPTAVRLESVQGESISRDDVVALIEAGEQAQQRAEAVRGRHDSR